MPSFQLIGKSVVQQIGRLCVGSAGESASIRLRQRTSPEVWNAVWLRASQRNRSRLWLLTNAISLPRSADAHVLTGQ